MDGGQVPAFLADGGFTSDVMMVGDIGGGFKGVTDLLCFIPCDSLDEQVVVTGEGFSLFTVTQGFPDGFPVG